MHTTEYIEQRTGSGLTDDEKARLAKLPAVDRLVLLATRQGMYELMIPRHPNGQCPESPCPCAGTDDALEARVNDILGLGAP